MVIYGVSFDMVGKQPIVLLKTVDGNKFLPIWIGHPEAAAILMKLQGASTPRPMTHDLLSEVLEQMDAKCERVSVTELRDNTFYAQIVLRANGDEHEIDSRPSDAIALAVRVNAPIFAADEVIAESSIEFEGEPPESEESVVDEFRGGVATPILDGGRRRSRLRRSASTSSATTSRRKPRWPGGRCPRPTCRPYRHCCGVQAFRLAPGFGLADVSAPADGARAIIGPMVRCMF